MQYTPFNHRILRVQVFAPLAVPLTFASAGLSAMNTIAGGNAAADAGFAQKQMYDFKARQDEINAQQSRAAAQRDALAKRKQADLALSKWQALSAASGGGTADPGALKIGSDLAGEGEYQALMAGFQGEQRARGLEDQSALNRAQGALALNEGESKRQRSILSAFNTILDAGLKLKSS